MKNLLYITGFSFGASIWLGSFFKLMHWPGAAILLIVGIVGLVAGFIPLALFGKYKPETSNNPLNLTLFITLFICLIGALFKILHWPGAGLLLIISMPLPFVLFLPVYMYQTLKTGPKSLNKVIIVISFITYLAVMSSLLALNINYDVLKGGLTILETKQKNIELYTSMLEEVHADISYESDALFDKIQDIKTELILQASSSNSEAVTGDYINVENLEMAERKIGIDEQQMQELTTGIADFIGNINNNPELSTESKQIVLEFFTTDSEQSFTDDRFRNNFKGQPMINCLNILTQIQEGIRFAQVAML